MELASADTRDEALAVLRGLGCGEPEPDERADRLTLPAPRNGLELVEEAAAALRSAGIGVSSLALRGPTLDDVFLQLTGAPPSEDGDQASGAHRGATARRARSRAPAAEAAPGPRPIAGGTALGAHRCRASSPAATCATSPASRSC